MSVRVVARLRPLLKAETQADVVVETASGPGDAHESKTVVRIPNPRKESEAFSFQFNSVYGQDASQSQLFEEEISPTVKHLFNGYDVTIFAYGVTGTGKTHTMRGGKSLADRGVIPRLLSSIYRRARKMEKDSEGASTAEVVMSYYEIYNDKVFDLFEPPEKRTAAGLPIRDNHGKTVVTGLTERPCTTLKEFEKLYDEANVNRSTSATKLNAHSSRSHAILCVKVVQTTGAETRISTASAIDLAGSEDNRRTDNNKDRLVESASINKSLFVLAQCVEAISKKQSRIPYRESKMTRILSLGQNNGLTVMILNLAPVRSYHLDTLSSLNFANRTKKIEVNEVENQPFLRLPPGKSKTDDATSNAENAPLINRQPLRPKLLSQESHLKDVKANTAKPTKQFSVYTDKAKPATKPKPLHLANTSLARVSSQPTKSPKRTSSEAIASFGRPSKISRPNCNPTHAALSKDAIEALIERKVSEALAERTDQTATSSTLEPLNISGEVQKRLEALEKRVSGQENERAEGLQYLLMAKQHQVRGEDASALKMYQLALPHFPDNEKLVRKVAGLQERIAANRTAKAPSSPRRGSTPVQPVARAVNANADASGLPVQRKKKTKIIDADESYCGANEDEEEDEDEFVAAPRTKIRRPQNIKLNRPVSVPVQTTRDAESEAEQGEEGEIDSSDDELASELTSQTPRTKHILNIINSKDVGRIRLLKGVGTRKAEAIVNCLCDLDDDARVTTLGQLGKLKGVGVKTVENMRNGVVL